MKTQLVKTLLGLTTLAATTSFAAKIETISTFEDPLMEDVADAAGEQVVYKFDYTPASSSENKLNMLKQAIYAQRVRESGGSRPDGVTVKKVVRTLAGVKEVAAAATQFENEHTKTAQQDRLRRAIVEAISINKEITLYTVKDGNSTGACWSGALIDDHAGQLLVISSCQNYEE